MPGGGSLGSRARKEIPVEHLDYAYIAKCSEWKELQDILLELRSGVEGRWPDLEKACEKRMLECMPPKKRKLYIAQNSEPTFEEVQSASQDVAGFLKEIKRKDENLTRRDCSLSSSKEIFADSPTAGSGLPLPPVRGTVNVPSMPLEPRPKAEKVADDSSSNSMRRISGYDFKAWDKFDVDKELARIDQEETRLEREWREGMNRRQAEIDERKILAEASKRTDLPPNVYSLPPDQREFFANREREKGNECYKAGEFEQAIKFYTKCILLMPKMTRDARPFANRAIVHLKLEHWEKAELDCDEALRIDNEFVKAYSRRGIARHRRGKYLDAIDDFEEALFRDPNNKDLNSLLAASRKKYNEVGGIGASKPGQAAQGATPKSSREKFTKLTIMEDDSDAEDERPENSCKNSELRPCTGKLSEGTASTVDDYVVVDSLSETLHDDWREARKKGEELFKTGNAEEAALAFKKALENLDSLEETSDFCDCLKKLTNCYCMLERWDRVVETSSKVLNFMAEDLDALYFRGGAFENQGKFQEALEDFCSVLRADSTQTEAGNRISSLMKKLQEETQPEEKGETKTDFDSLKKQGNELFSEKEFEEAMAKYEKCLEINPQDVTVLSNQAMVLIHLKKYKECENVCTRALGLSSTDSSPQIRLKVLFRRSQARKAFDDLDGARSDLQELLAQQPRHARAQAELANLDLLQRKSEESCEAVAREEKKTETDELAKRAAAHAASKLKNNFPLPKTSYEFHHVWRSLNATERASYLVAIPPCRLKGIFKIEIEEDILMSIVETLNTSVVQSNPTHTAAILHEMSQIGRFGTTVRFLSSSQRETILSLISKCNDPTLQSAFPISQKQK